MNVLLHSYTFRDYPLEEAFRCGDRFDYDGIELHRAHFDEDHLDEELPRCQELAEKYAVPIACVDFTADLINEDPGIIEKCVGSVERNIGVCARFGVPLMNGYAGVLTQDPDDYGRNGSALATDAHYERATEALRRLARAAEQGHVTLTLEIHMNTLHDTIASTARLLDSVGSRHLLANPDPANMLATSTAETGPNALDPLRDRIGHFHFKNCREHEGGYTYSVGLAEGDVDTWAYLQKLRELRYNGPVCIEYVGKGDPYVRAEQDIAYLREGLEWLSKAEAEGP